jgi:WD40 repeat protein
MIFSAAISSRHDPVGNILVWDLQKERQLFKVQAHQGFTRTISWPFDEKILVTTGQSDNCIKVWEIPSGKLLKTVRLDVEEVHYGSVSPTGKYFAGSGKNGTVTIWDLESEKRIRSYTGYPSYIWSIAWSADEKLVYSGHRDGTIVAWETNIRN